MQDYPDAHVDHKTGMILYCGQLQCRGVLGHVMQIRGESRDEVLKRWSDLVEMGVWIVGPNDIEPWDSDGNPVAVGTRMKRIPDTGYGEPELDGECSIVLLSEGYCWNEEQGSYRLTNYARNRVRRRQRPKNRQDDRDVSFPIADESGRGLVDNIMIEYRILPAITRFPAIIECPRCFKQSVVSEKGLVRRPSGVLK